MFEIYTMFTEIHDNADSILGVKTCVELKGERSIRQLSLSLWIKQQISSLCIKK